MLLQLDDNFRVVIDSSGQNLQLEELQPIIDKKSRKIVRQDWILKGYHGLSMRSVLLQYRNAALITDDKLTTLHDILDRLNEIENTIIKVVKQENIQLGTRQDD